MQRAVEVIKEGGRSRDSGFSSGSGSDSDSGTGRLQVRVRIEPPPPHTHTHTPALLLPTTIRPSRSLMSARSEASASTAMISEATAISKPVERSCPRSSLPWPTVMERRNLHAWGCMGVHGLQGGCSGVHEVAWGCQSQPAALSGARVKRTLPPRL